MIDVSFAGTDTLILEAIGAKVEDVGAAVMSELDALDAEMVSYIVEDELHGQVLNQRKGILAGSIRQIPARQEGTSIIGQVEGGGAATGIHTSHGDSSYAELFEYGRTVDIVPIKAKALRFETIEGEVIYAKKVHLELPRPFMAPAQLHFVPIIDERIEKAIGDALAK